MSWYVGNTPSVVHDKPFKHGGTRMGLLANREGYGAAAYGGLFGDEVQVTTLADDVALAHNSPGDYSLRAAVAVASPKWITFKAGLTAPARSTWPAPYNSAPLARWRSDAIWLESGREIDIPANTTIDGRGSTYRLQGRGFRCDGSNVIIHNMTIDCSSWWAGELAGGTAGLYNIWDADSAYSKGPQAIQRAGQCWSTVTVDRTILPGNWKGTWVSGTAYQAGDIPFDAATKNPPDGVVYSGVGYRCILATSGTTPPPSDSTHWTPDIGGAVNGAIYGGIKEQVVAGIGDVGWSDFWFDHCTLIGPATGDGNPAKNPSIGLHDFNDGGFAVCYKSHNVTYSWNHYQDMNKSSIIGCGSTDQTDMITHHHSWFQRGFQRQPLARDSHVHVYASWYDQPGTATTPTAIGEVIACDNNVEMLYEGNLAESAIHQPNAFAYKRGGAATKVVGAANGNVCLDQMFLGSDIGPLSFSPPYSYSLPNLVGSTNQQAFRDLITAGAGAH